MKIFNNYSLKKLSTLGIGGIIKNYIELESISEFFDFIKNNEEIFIIGNGSNLIFKDIFYDKTFIKLKNEFESIHLIENNVVAAGAGCRAGKLLDVLISNCLSGFEWAVGIPALLGGMICNNAGAFKNNISDFIIRTVCYDLNKNIICELSKQEMNFLYRDSIFKKNKNLIILNGVFKYIEEQFDTLQSNIKKNLEFRNKTQPLNFRNAGSIFKNFDENLAAGKLLEDVGLKGFRINNMGFSDIHSNFIINYGNGTFEEFSKLIDIAKEKVYNKFGIELSLEVEIV